MKNKKVSKFNELMTPEMSKQLGLFSFSKNSDDTDYFFDFKEVNKLWDEDVIKVLIYNMRFDGDSLIFKSEITIYGEEFDIYILVDYNENVEFGSEEGSDYIETFEAALEDELDYFKDMFEDIYNELVPHDFWEVKTRVG